MKLSEILKEDVEIWRASKLFFIIAIPALIMIFPIALLDKNNKLIGE